MLNSSSSATICFGVLLDDLYPFPWVEHNTSFESWWLYIVCGYVPPFELFDQEGNYINKEVIPDSDSLQEYFFNEKEFLKLYPLPYTIVSYYTSHYPSYILARSDSVVCTSHKRALAFTLPQVNSTSPLIAKEMLDFCETYSISTNGEPNWFLTAQIDN